MTLPETEARSSTTPRRLRAVVREAARELASAGIEGATRDARLIVAAALGIDGAGLIGDLERPLGEREMAQIAALVRRRKRREPVARILGRREFYGRSFAVGPATLDPRPESETLIEAALELVAAEGWSTGASGRPLRILDVGTGSGCLLVTLLAELECAWGVGSDISLAALETARANAHGHGVGRRASWVCGSALELFGGSFDLVVANPPYIPTVDIAALPPEVRLFDPAAALDGGTDGLEVTRSILARVARVITDGWLLLEVGFGQAEIVSGLTEQAMVGRLSAPVRIFSDLGGHGRCVAARARG